LDRDCFDFVFPFQSQSKVIGLLLTREIVDGDIATFCSELLGNANSKAPVHAFGQNQGGDDQ
jgi:hypothetical protein